MPQKSRFLCPWVTSHLSPSLLPSSSSSPSLPPSPEVFQGLQGVLERLRGETFTWDEDINFVQETLADPDFLQLCEVNDGVAESQSFEQPVASLEDAMKEVQY